MVAANAKAIHIQCALLIAWQQAWAVALNSIPPVNVGEIPVCQDILAQLWKWDFANAYVGLSGASIRSTALSFECSLVEGLPVCRIQELGAKIQG